MDASFFYISGYMNQQVDRVHYCPFTIVLTQEWPHYEPERNPIVSKKEGESILRSSCISVSVLLQSNQFSAFGKKESLITWKQTPVISSPAQHMKAAELLPVQSLTKHYTRTPWLLNHSACKIIYPKSYLRNQRSDSHPAAQALPWLKQNKPQAYKKLTVLEEHKRPFVMPALT